LLESLSVREFGEDELEALDDEIVDVEFVDRALIVESLRGRSAVVDEMESRRGATGGCATRTAPEGPLATNLLPITTLPESTRGRARLWLMDARDAFLRAASALRCERRASALGFFA